jgi:hypothetical protein
MCVNGLMLSPRKLFQVGEEHHRRIRIDPEGGVRSAERSIARTVRPWHRREASFVFLRLP